jgi:hypothetical protein
MADLKFKGVKSKRKATIKSEQDTPFHPERARQDNHHLCSLEIEVEELDAETYDTISLTTYNLDIVLNNYWPGTGEVGLSIHYGLAGWDGFAASTGNWPALVFLTTNWITTLGSENGAFCKEECVRDWIEGNPKKFWDAVKILLTRDEE